MMSYDYPHPVSRTYQYKKITKPALERKRRARMNKSVEQLKNLMIDALETEAENISKLEKADILELTVRHIQRLHSSQSSGLSPVVSQNEDPTAESRWQSGFGHCAAEACRYLAALPGESGEKLARHLASGLESMRKLNIQIIPKDELMSPNPIASPHLTLTPAGPPSLEMPSPSMASPHRLSPAPPLVNAPGIPFEPAPKKLCNPRERSEPQTPMPTEDEEEIDVEGVDDNDPMWRPW
ncbi:enhancer of split mbeta protein [Diachasma alloeum]|uniref:enhancer of split mbeta protein n=1 Tax=Diachasma alloeum TaxID=454923 RepID=UPI00073834AA|nr:enhancer of split mbeta protein [Diachasma alloeum]